VKGNRSGKHRGKWSRVSDMVTTTTTLVLVGLLTNSTSAALAPRVGGSPILPPYHGHAHCVSTPGLYGACVSTKNPTLPSFNYTTGSGGINTTTRSHDCPKSPGYGDAYSDVTLLANITLPTRAGVSTITANYSYSLALILSVTGGRCVPLTSSGGSCWSSSEYNLSAWAYVINVSKGPWWNGGASSGIIGGYYEQLTNTTYCSSGSCAFSNYSNGCSFGGCGAPYPSQTGWITYTGKGQLVFSLPTPMGHGYRYVLQLSLWVRNFSLTGSSNATYHGYRASASMNFETQGNGLRLTSITES